MKNIKSLLLLLIITSFGFSACQKDIVFVEGSGPGGKKPQATKTYMKAKVDGVWLECEFADAQQLIAPDGKKGLQITGNKGTQGFIFVWEDFKGVGTYNAADLLSSGNYYAGGTDPITEAYTAENGVIKITTYNSKEIIGTFEFKGANSVGNVKTISEGQFTIKLITDPTPDPNAVNTISVKIDGVQTSFLDGQIVDAGAINIVGMMGNGTISLGIFDYNGPGTYTVTGEINKGAHLSYNPNANTSYHSISGKIIVTSSTATSIAGTFEGVLKLENSSTTTLIKFTEGKFNVKD